MYIYFISSEFWQNILWILAISAALTPIILIVRVLIWSAPLELIWKPLVWYKSLAWLGVYFVYVLPFVGNRVGTFMLDWFRENGSIPIATAHMNQIKKVRGSIAILQKESPQLYDHYRELANYEADAKNKLFDLQKEKDSVSTPHAIETFEKKIKDINDNLKLVSPMRNRIEQIAAKIHIAHFMSNCGLDVTDSELQKEMTKITQDGSNMLDKFSSRKPTK